ncbi:methyl-CpG-binding domain-containing protein 8 isoform X2 [Raphanus sativus]|uniref:Methyl-CpG-binding domain-containing protein 8 isoform X2 n=1 Tax=Raphanus sativus TaxID=3726 RepID=A0A6J0K032_RAPSA|nr:methyl-CpG-binding domain-containing protein 8 isoform X2 [Raphanus sativus]
MSPPVVENRRFSASASRATLRHLNLLLRNGKETIRPAKKWRRFSDLCSQSIRLIRKRKKRLKSMSKGNAGDERRKRPGRPRKIMNPSDLGISTESNPGKRKRGHPPKIRDGSNQNFKIEDKEESVDLENREGTVVDLSALACVGEDPYGDELRRMTMGLVTSEELLGFLEEMNGDWVNAGKRNKVVKACDYGGYLPRGWKLMLCIKKQGSNLWLACHRYISPDGHEFANCKEVATYVQALIDSRSKNQLNSLQPENKTREQPVMANEPVVDSSDSASETTLERKRTSSEVCDEDTTDPVKTRLVEEDDKGISAANFANGDNMENVAALSNSEAQFGEKDARLFI